MDQIAARRDERVMLISPAEILYAYAQEKNVYLRTREGDWTVSFTLAELEERLAAQGFFCAHRGYLVNLAEVREIATWTRSSFSLRDPAEQTPAGGVERTVGMVAKWPRWRSSRPGGAPVVAPVHQSSGDCGEPLPMMGDWSRGERL